MLNGATKAVGLVVCASGTQICSQFAAGEVIRTEFLAGAAVLAGLAALISIAEIKTRGPVEDRKWPNWLAGLSGAATIYILYQVFALGLSLGVGSSLQMVGEEVALSSAQVQTIVLGVFTTIPFFLGPVAVLVGATTLYQGKNLWASGVFAALAFVILVALGQASGFLTGGHANLHLLGADGLSIALQGLGILVAGFTAALVAGAALRQLIAKIEFK